jgi:hypothetical protein
MGKFYSTINHHKKRSDTIFILGSGPSLKPQLEEYSMLLQSETCLCVNSFATTQYFTQIKPAIFVLMDPVLFLPDNKLVEPIVKQNNSTIWNSLLQKTTWPIDVIIPAMFKDSECVHTLQQNSFINFLFINMDYFAEFKTKKEQFHLFNNNLIPVPAITVLNTAVYLGIFWKYKKIVLLGADSSWHENWELDQKTNELFTKDTHFHDSKKRRVFEVDSNGNIILMKLYEDFFGIATILRDYWILKEYADFNSVSVYNASGKSYIDAFERRTLNTLFTDPATVILTTDNIKK